MVKNGLEASAEGDCITIHCQTEGDEIVFRVHSPAYMPEEVQAKVFHRSFSTKGAGRGLGTYSMKLLTEGYLRGKIGFTSTPQEGTTFIGCYPLNWGALRADTALEVACVSEPAELAGTL
jgi:sensor histidine kinase regulating citrate/malate metabolism